MKRLIILLVPVIFFASCGGGNKDKGAELSRLKQERSKLDQQIKALEGPGSDSSKKATPVSLIQVQPTDFVATINVQSQITGDQNTYASPQTPGIVSSVLVHAGEHVAK